MPYRASVVVPSLGTPYLKVLLLSLSRQTVRPSEVVVVLKGAEPRRVEEVCAKKALNCVVVEQCEGYVTHALNLGKRSAGGDVVIFTDEDAVPNPRWVETYLKLHRSYSAGCISSRDIYLDLREGLKKGPEEQPLVRLRKWLARPWLRRPHPLLKKYRLGVYITNDMRVAFGPYIPGRTCYSLPYRGVNMSFKKEALDEVEFPEHPLLKRGIRYEQYVGLQLVLKGWDSIYVPYNPVLHIVRESLSRPRSRYGVEEVARERELMRAMFAELITHVHKKQSEAV